LRGRAPCDGSTGRSPSRAAFLPRPRPLARAATPHEKPAGRRARGPRAAARDAIPPPSLHPKPQHPPGDPANHGRSPCSGDQRPAARPGKERSSGTLLVIYRFTGYESRQPPSTGGHFMARFTQYTIADAPEASRPLLQQVDKALGFIPNLYATFAESPALLEGALALDAGLDKGALSGVERQLVKIAVSAENACTYCVAAHSTIAGMLKARPDVVVGVRSGAPVGDARIDALVTFTRAVVRDKGFVPETAIAAFLAAGYTKAQLLEVVGHVAAKTLANYIHAITNAPLDAAFQPQRWDAKQLKVA